MSRFRLPYVFAVLGLVAVTGAVRAAQAPKAPGDIAVHEWGTFTSVAGEDGQAIEWRPLSGPSDLPCFVHMIPDSPKSWYPGGLAGTPATVRMETPVVYFYAQQPATLRVSVQFPQGLITEWFPAATVTPLGAPQFLTSVTSGAQWTTVNVVPDEKPAFLSEPGESHYYAARETDASPVRVAGELEKFLFYRGIASFPVPLAVRVAAPGRLEVNNTSAFDIAQLVVFESRGGRIGYRATAGPRGVTTVAAPTLDGTIAGLRAELERMLIAQGLFPREAKAMVETWRDSWFEEGTRVFYFLPKAAVDQILPLSVAVIPQSLAPQPSTSIARAFVGRVEVVTPAMMDDVSAALTKGDLMTLNKYGRVLQPIVNRVLAKAVPQFDQARVTKLLQQVAASHVREYACR